MTRTPSSKALATAVGLAATAPPTGATDVAAGTAPAESMTAESTGEAAHLLFSRAAAQRLLARELGRKPHGRKAHGHSYAALAQYFKELADSYEKRAQAAAQSEAPGRRPAPAASQTTQAPAPPPAAPPAPRAQ